MSKKVIVVGGGIAGLAAFRQLQVQQPNIEVVLLEASPHLGGKIRTTDFLGRQIDEGADAFITRVPWALELCDQLGLGSLLVSPASSSAYVLINGVLRKLPKGLVLGVPTKLLPLIRSRVVSPFAALRAGFDRFLPDDWPGDDESVGGLIRRRMGDQIADRLVDPLIGSINAGDTDHLDAALAAPQLETAARRHRSLISGLKEQTKKPAGTSAPVFLGLELGMGQLIETLVRSLGEADIRTGTPVTGINKNSDNLVVRTQQTSIECDAVILATPAHQAALLLAECQTAADRLSSIEHASVAMVTLGFRRADVGHPLDGSGMLIPRGEGLLTTAVSWGSSKWPHWADTGHAIFRVSAGRAGDTRALALEDDELVEELLTEVANILDINGDLLEWRVSRWIDAFPQYAPAHDRLVAAIERDLRSEMGGLFLAGAGYKGIGIPACIQQGNQSAEAALDYLKTL